MKDQSIARQLLCGSHNLDYMRKDIEEVVKMMIGMALKAGRMKGGPRNLNEKFEADSYKWEVNGGVGNGDRRLDAIEVSCWLDDRWGFSQGFRITAEGSEPPRLESVQRVYEALDTFVEGMRKMFPEIEKEWEPIIRASHKEL